MTDPIDLRRLIRHTQNLDLPLLALEGVRDIRVYLAEVEWLAVCAALERGASVQDIAEALGVTRQAVYYKLRRPAGGDAEDEDEADIVEIPEPDTNPAADEPSTTIQAEADEASNLRRSLTPPSRRPGPARGGDPGRS